MARGRKNPNPKQDQDWKKALEAQRKIDAQKVEAIEDWIESNKDLWDKLSDVQRAQIADIDNMASKTEVLKQRPGGEAE